MASQTVVSHNRCESCIAKSLWRGNHPCGASPFCSSTFGENEAQRHGILAMSWLWLVSIAQKVAEAAEADYNMFRYDWQVVTAATAAEQAQRRQSTAQCVDVFSHLDIMLSLRPFLNAQINLFWLKMPQVNPFSLEPEAFWGWVRTLNFKWWFRLAKSAQVAARAIVATRNQYVAGCAVDRSVPNGPNRGTRVGLASGPSSTCICPAPDSCRKLHHAVR